MILAPSLTAMPSSASHPEDVRVKRDVCWEFAERCLIQTSKVLSETRAASVTDIFNGLIEARNSHAVGKPADLLEMIARIQGHSEEHLGAAVLNLGNIVAATLTPYQPVIPFGTMLLAPSAFYESYDQLHKIARVLLAPVIYAEDSDVIGTASINPIASKMMAEEIRSTVFKRFGIGPFVTTTRLDYPSWISISHKHFEL
jgi:hypothetical protein